MRSQPTWQARVDAAHTIPRELRAVKAYRLDPKRFGDVGVPTLLLSGGESPAALRKAAEAVDEMLPDSRMVVMTGHGHAAMDTGTDLFTSEVLRFLDGIRMGFATGFRGHEDSLIHRVSEFPRTPYTGSPVSGNKT